MKRAVAAPARAVRRDSSGAERGALAGRTSGAGPEPRAAARAPRLMRGVLIVTA